ncbi:hypothetical protein PFISCL1PPCAC_18738, partial [Pristionchus fissidentatus]
LQIRRKRAAAAAPAKVKTGEAISKPSDPGTKSGSAVELAKKKEDTPQPVPQTILPDTAIDEEDIRSYGDHLFYSTILPSFHRYSPAIQKRFEMELC